MTVRIICNGFSIKISNESFEEVMDCVERSESTVDGSMCNRDDYERLHDFNHKMRNDRIKPAFSVELAGSFHTFKLLDSMGRNLTSKHQAAEFAEEEFGSDWNSVFNGEESIERDDFLAYVKRVGL